MTWADWVFLSRYNWQAIFGDHPQPWLCRKRCSPLIDFQSQRGNSTLFTLDTQITIFFVDVIFVGHFHSCHNADFSKPVRCFAISLIYICMQRAYLYEVYLELSSMQWVPGWTSPICWLKIIPKPCLSLVVRPQCVLTQRVYCLRKRQPIHLQRRAFFLVLSYSFYEKSMIKYLCKCVF